MAQSTGQIVVSALVFFFSAVIATFMMLTGVVLQQLKSPTKNLFSTKRRDIPPKCLQDKEIGQHGYVTVKGLKFHYVEKGDHSKPMMLFVHGFPEFWYSWRHQMKEFSKDYWTVAIDLRGYGESAKPTKVSDYNTDLLLEDIKGIVTELGKKKVILVGHDWGSVLGWMFVDKYPEMVEKYVMMNGPHPDVHMKLMRKSITQLLKSWYIAFFQVPFLPELYLKLGDFGFFKKVFLGPKKSNPYITNDDIEAFKYTFSRPGALTPLINFYRAWIRKAVLQGVKPGEGGKVKSKATRPPGLYIFGANDLALELAGVNMHNGHIESLQTHIIPEGTHFIQQDEPDAVHSAMHSFLKK